MQDWCIRPYYPSYSHSGIALSSATGMTRSQGGMAILTSGGARCCQGKREDSNTTTTGFTVWRLRTCRPGSTAAGLLADSATRGLSISFWTSSRVASLDALFVFLRSITIIMPRPMVRGTVNSDQVSRLEMNSFGIVAVAGFRQICVTGAGRCWRRVHASFFFVRRRCKGASPRLTSSTEKASGSKSSPIHSRSSSCRSWSGSLRASSRW